MAMGGVSSAWGGARAAAASDPIRVSDQSVESKVKDVQTARDMVRKAWDSAAMHAELLDRMVTGFNPYQERETLTVRDPVTMNSLLAVVEANSRMAQALADLAERRFAEVFNDPRATDVDKLVAGQAAKQAADFAEGAARAAESARMSLMASPFRASAPTRLDDALNPNTIHQLNGMRVNGTTRTYAHFALSQASSASSDSGPGRANYLRNLYGALGNQTLHQQGGLRERAENNNGSWPGTWRLGQDFRSGGGSDRSDDGAGSAPGSGGSDRSGSGTGHASGSSSSDRSGSGAVGVSGSSGSDRSGSEADGSPGTGGGIGSDYGADRSRDNPGPDRGGIGGDYGTDGTGSRSSPSSGANESSPNPGGDTGGIGGDYGRDGSGGDGYGETGTGWV